MSLSRSCACLVVSCLVVLLVNTSSRLMAADDGSRPVLFKVGGNTLQVETPQSVPPIAVNSTADSTTAGNGLCTLREAIINANNGGDSSGGDCVAGTASGADFIVFAIPNGSLRATIAMTAILPTVTDPVTIDGNSQCATPPCIKVDGSGVPNPGDVTLNALTVAAGSSVIRGLVFSNWPIGGLQLEGAVGGNLVEGNHFGVDFNGTTHTPLSGTGIEIESPDNAIGGTTLAARNLISGNSQYGIAITGTNATGNTVAGNYIGTNAAGTSAVGSGNGNGGIFINMADSNLIGGTTAGAGNLISGNGNGVEILSSDNTNIQGNLISTDATGTSAIGNGLYGILLTGTTINSLIGGVTIAARNVVSGSIFGISFQDSTSGNTVQGNFIGTNAAGSAALPNITSGIIIQLSSTDNLIGGTVAGAGNLISGNNGTGIAFYDAASGNTVQGNLIGTNALGTEVIPNITQGIYSQASGSQTIGGDDPMARNVIAGNLSAGIYFLNPSSNNTVKNNYIGVGSDGTTAMPNHGRGILIWESNSNQIGGVGVGNRIWSNQLEGIHVLRGSINNQIIANDIRSNTASGILVEDEPTIGNTLSQNLLFNNGGFGIDLNSDGPNANDNLDPDTGPNNFQNFPELASATPGNSMITGTLNSLANTQFTIEYFSSSACDPSGHGEGQFYLGNKQVTTSGSGIADVGTTVGVNVIGGHFVTATATAPDGSTSEFSPCMQVPDLLFKDGFETLL